MQRNIFMKTMEHLDCPSNCSGHGECLNGVCFCQLEYQGAECSDYNNAYFMAFGLIFYLLSACCIIQLILCIQSEIRRFKDLSCQRAVRVTTQKLLYFLVTIAALSRALYFSLQPYLPEIWACNMLSMYYPLLLSCFSLVVCFWAEAFHLSDKQHNNPGFLMDSFLYFFLFNVFLYILLIAEIITMEIASLDLQLLSSIFNGCFASLMIIEVVFFLVYGIEVFFRIKGAFTVENTSTDQCSSPPQSDINSINCSGETRSQPRRDISVHPLASHKTVDVSIMHQSRIGMLFQGLLQVAMVMFLMMKVTEPQWREGLSVFKRNVHDVMFHIVEVGLALWFPCVLWKSRSPESLWILNPTRLFRHTQDEENLQGLKKEEDSLLFRKHSATYDATFDSSKEETEAECWICYDRRRTDAGPMIQPCGCKGDMAYVHHECLKRWLMESADNPESLQCTVCQEKYELKSGSSCFLQGFHFKQGLMTVAVLGIMFSGPLGVYFIIKHYDSDVATVAAIAACILLEMVCFKYLGISLCIAHTRANVSSLRILDKMANRKQVDVTTVPSVSTNESGTVSTVSASLKTEISADVVQVHCA